MCLASGIDLEGALLFSAARVTHYQQDGALGGKFLPRGEAVVPHFLDPLHSMQHLFPQCLCFLVANKGSHLLLFWGFKFHPPTSNLIANDW